MSDHDENEKLQAIFAKLSLPQKRRALEILNNDDTSQSQSQVKISVDTLPIEMWRLVQRVLFQDSNSLHSLSSSYKYFRTHLLPIHKILDTHVNVTWFRRFLCLLHNKEYAAFITKPKDSVYVPQCYRFNPKQFVDPDQRYVTLLRFDLDDKFTWAVTLSKKIHPFDYHGKMGTKICKMTGIIYSSSICKMTGIIYSSSNVPLGTIMDENAHELIGNFGHSLAKFPENTPKTTKATIKKRRADLLELHKSVTTGKKQHIYPSLPWVMPKGLQECHEKYHNYWSQRHAATEPDAQVAQFDYATHWYHIRKIQ